MFLSAFVVTVKPPIQSLDVIQQKLNVQRLISIINTLPSIVLIHGSSGQSIMQNDLSEWMLLRKQ